MLARSRPDVVVTVRLNRKAVGDHPVSSIEALGVFQDQNIAGKCQHVRSPYQDSGKTHSALRLAGERLGFNNWLAAATAKWIPLANTNRSLLLNSRIINAMKIKVVVHDAEEGGYWAEVPALPGCATQGETFEELLRNLYEAVEGCLSVDVSHHEAAARNDLSTTRPCDCS